jgi:SnoaL-like domain
MALLNAAAKEARMDFEKLMQANLDLVFGERDPTRRIAAIRRIYDENAELHEPERSPTSPRGRDALEALVAGLSRDVHYEPGLIVAEGDLVAIHGRIRGWADEAQVGSTEDDRLAEHWDVLQNEAPVTAHGGVSMFEPDEGARRARGKRDARRHLTHHLPDEYGLARDGGDEALHRASWHTSRPIVRASHQAPHMSSIMPAIPNIPTS